MSVNSGAYLRIAGLNTSAIRESITQSIAAAVRNAQKDFTDHVRLSFNQPKHGRVYYRPGRIHRASAPGEAPAIDYGNLNKKIRTTYRLRGTMARVVFSPVYASWLEEGTANMQPRPYAQPALDAIRNNFIQDLRSRLTRDMASL